MEDKNLKNSVLERIERDNIKPKPRWQFLLRNNVIWALGGVSVVVGGIAVAETIYMLTNSDWELYAEAADGHIEFWLESIPYFWLLLLVVFIAAARYNIKHTKRGYQYGLPIVVFGTVAGSAVFGIILHAAGVGRAIDVALEESIPAYSQYLAPRHKPWDNPQRGVLSGRVIEIESTQRFMIQDRRGNVWVIIATDAKILPEEKMIRTERVVRMIGEQVDYADYTFDAELIGIKPKGHPFGPGKRGKRTGEIFFEELRITE